MDLAPIIDDTGPDLDHSRWVAVAAIPDTLGLVRRTTAVILAGGRATRMGRDKALVDFRGIPMIDHVSTALRSAGLEVLVVGRKTSASGVAGIPDIDGLGGGPAIGLLTAFRHVDSDDVLLVAVDQPRLRPETVRGLLALPGDAVVPSADGHPQVTCALYRRQCHEPLEELLSSGQSKLRRLLPIVDTTFVEESAWTAWGEDGRSWMSLDTPQALRDAEALP